MLSGVKRLSRGAYLLLADGKISTCSKELSALEDSTRDEELGYNVLFEAFSKAAKNRKVSVDLTGGQDSRLNVALLNHHTESYETALSGFPEHPDLTIGMRIAKVLNKVYWPTIYQG